jgi:hypothetical protein
MKMKTWTVITNTGKQAGLESGLEKKEFKKADAHQRQRVCSLGATIAA